VGANLVHNKFEVIVVLACDNIIAVIRIECNPLTNNCTIVNISIRKSTTNFVYNRKLESVSI
jgi:hypothetical protein